MVRINGAFEIEFQSRPRAEDLHFIFESSFQSTGSQMDGLLLEQKAANFRRGFVGGFCDRFEFPLKLLGLAYQFVKAELGTQLNSGQQLEYAVVQLPGDAPPLFLNRCRRSCVLESCSAIPSVFQVYLLGPQDQSIDYSDRSLCLSALPKTHDMGKIPHLERLFPEHREGRRFQQGAITEQAPAGQTSFPPAVPVSKALARSDNEPKPPSFVSPFLPGHRHRDLHQAPLSPVHAPRFAQVSDASLRVSLLHGRLRATCWADLDIFLRHLVSTR